jgi:L-ascorbate metabolism protein UlaG (beta-lactamase superfamily)
LKLKWIAHCCFLITSDNGLRILTDPYESQMSLRWDPLNEEADIITISHEHFDHNNVLAVRGNPQILREAAVVKGIKFQLILTEHGAQMGENRVFCFEVDGVRLCHCGDLGHELSDAQAATMGRVDVLMIPVGGTYTIDAAIATRICDRLKPSVAIPMHFSCEKVLSKILAPVDEFLKGKDHVAQIDSCEIELHAKDLPAESKILLPKSQN